MKKNTILFNILGVVLCGLTTPVAADFCDQTCNDCCEWSILDGKVTAGVDWLYWNVQQDGVLPGSVVITDSTVVPTATSVSRVHPSQRWNNGFRVSLGYEMPCDCWDVNVCYTYMPGRANVTNFAAASADQTFLSPVLGDSFAAFTSKWNQTFNNVDLDIGRTVCFGECLKMRPHVGFRATWFDQKFRALGATAPTETTVNFTALVLKEKFQGYGVEAGIWTEYKMGYNIALVGHFGGSILYSKFKIHGDSATGTTATDVTTLTEVLTTRNSFYAATPSLDYFVGLQYADSMCDTLFKIRAGWEQHVLFDTNRYLATGNLSLQGLTLGLDVSF